MRFTPAVDASSGEMYLPVYLRGRQLLEEPLLNKGTAFTPEERDSLELRGLLPAHTSTMDEHLLRVRSQLEAKKTSLEKHIYLAALHDRNETLFHRFVMENLEEMVPIIYTPTVAEACAHWSRIYRSARGVYVTPEDRGRIAKILRSRGARDPDVIVVTDNERILGIGDQGAGGMGIPIGKLALYSVGAGIHPSVCLPISLDVGTNNDSLLADPLYLGWREPRLRGDPYWSLVEEFVFAVKEVFPRALLQWEDFANATSFANLDTYRDVLPSFNDDIQGTAAMVVAGLLVAERITGKTLETETTVIAGAGSAGLGIASQIGTLLVDRGLKPEELRTRILVMDSAGLVVEGRDGLNERKQSVAAPRELVAGWNIGPGEIALADVVSNARAGILIGVSGLAGLFDEKLIRSAAANAHRPVVMPLSNPTSKTEATPADILAWSEGRALVATGSPFPPVVHDGVTHRIAQANNMFMFPGIGLGTIAVRATQVTPGMFNAGAQALANCVEPEGREAGCLYPPITDVRFASHRVAVATARQAIADGVAEPVVDIESVINRIAWIPTYLPYRAA